MQATSLASAAEPQAVEEAQPQKIARLRRPSARALWPEATGEALKRASDPILHGVRSGWLYRQTLHGPVPDRILFVPDDPRPKRLDDADAIMRGRFRFAGQLFEPERGSIFDQKMPSAEFAAALHGFEWLRHLEAAGGDIAREFALKLTQHWLRRFEHYTTQPWRAEISAERLFNIFAHGRFFLTNTEMVWRSRLFVSLRDQACILARSIDEAPEGLPRLKAAASLALAGFCLGDTRNATLGVKRLSHEIEKQILPDGGHVSRSPDALLEAYRLLMVVQQSLDNAGRVTQVAVRSGLDRMGPMLRFFRIGDGALPVFNGGGEGEPAVIDALLAPEDQAAEPLGHAPHSGYQRLSSGRTLVLLDAGCPPPGGFSCQAHAGALSFEMSSGLHRVIVNCGAAMGQQSGWETALRSTAAHSALTMADSSQAHILEKSYVARLLGPRLMGGATMVETRRTQNEHGLTVEATQDAYVSRFGALHQRRLNLSPRGLALMGADTLIPVETKAWTRRHNGRVASAGIPFTIRFHVHPDVRLSLAQARGSVLLKLPNGEGWRFRCGGGTLSIEESVYFGGGSPRRTEQLVINGRMGDKPAEAAWVFELVGSS